MKTNNRKTALELVVEAVDGALENYSSENVDVVKNEETGMLDVIYHSDRHSFPIQKGVSDPEQFFECDKATLVKELNKRHVGYCW